MVEAACRMNVLEQLIDFIMDPSTWTGPASFWTRLFEHLWVSVAATLIGIVLVFPLALYLGHTKRGSQAATAVVNVGRAVPSFGILAVAFLILVEFGAGVGTPWAVLVALIALAAPPVFTNTIAGIQSVDPATVEAARGMGLTGSQVLARIELPMAMPLVMEGIRIAFVQVIATATLGALVAWGGLGRYIIDGFAVRDNGQILFGALAVGLLAIAAEVGFSLIQRAVTPRGLRVAR
ncbi:MAG: ABC transporter permease [Actinobacteria bacterium]|nr:MAG: ABC transporter permease [Actinomycetota bacterium]